GSRGPSARSGVPEDGSLSPSKRPSGTPDIPLPSGPVAGLPVTVPAADERVSSRPGIAGALRPAPGAASTTAGEGTASSDARGPRRFGVALAAVLGILILVVAGLGTASLLQGPR